MDHLSLFLIHLIKAFTRITLTPSGNDEWATGKAEFGTLRNVSVAVGGGGRWSRRQEGRGVVVGVVEEKGQLTGFASMNKRVMFCDKRYQDKVKTDMKSHIRSTR